MSSGSGTPTAWSMRPGRLARALSSCSIAHSDDFEGSAWPTPRAITGSKSAVRKTKYRPDPFRIKPFSRTEMDMVARLSIASCAARSRSESRSFVISVLMQISLNLCQPLGQREIRQKPNNILDPHVQLLLEEEVRLIGVNAEDSHRFFVYEVSNLVQRSIHWKVDS